MVLKDALSTTEVIYRRMLWEAYNKWWLDNVLEGSRLIIRRLCPVNIGSVSFYLATLFQLIIEVV